jgi:hypothetical protein
MLQEFLTQRVKRGLVRRWNNARIASMAREVARRAPDPSGQPVAFFKASTGIDDLSWNSGFHLLTSWALRLQGVPVVYFACNAGMSRCVLGTSRHNVHEEPPCRSCIYQSRTLYAGLEPAASRGAVTAALPGSRVHWFTFDRDPDLDRALENLSLAQLSGFSWTTPAESRVKSSTEVLPLPLGSLCLPGLRWILRRYNLDDDADTRFLLREYILSAWNVAREFSRFLDETDPRAVVVFNGQFFPEAIARYLAQRRGLRVITHEVGLQPASAFFTDGEATAYPIHISDDFDLTGEQNARLDEYLQQRFQGRFSMAGIQFWPSIRGLDDAFLARASRFRQIVPVFTNVIFDTSQPHANTVFSDMFAWLEAVLAAIRSHPDTVFVIRAHPDETRTRKESRETVQEWVTQQGVDRLDNVVFIAPQEYLSSYELIQRSKFVLVYNSTIGLEASIMGKPVLCGGRARFTQYPTVFFPQSIGEQQAALKRFLEADAIQVPPEFQRNARRFLYYQLFRASLPFGEFLEPSVRKTQTRLKTFDLDRLSPEESPALEAVSRGLLGGGDFLLKE